MGHKAAAHKNTGLNNGDHVIVTGGCVWSIIHNSPSDPLCPATQQSNM